MYLAVTQISFLSFSDDTDGLIFRALDAVTMSWDNLHLKHILSSDTYCSHIPESSLISGSFNSQGQPLWHGK